MTSFRPTLSMAGRWAVLVAGLTCMGLMGCASTKTQVGTALGNLRRPVSGEAATERIYSIAWWARGDPNASIPFKPFEPGEPEFDAITGQVFVVAEKKVRAFNERGQLQWDYDADSAFDAGPTVDGGILYVASCKGKLIALDARTGKLQWEYLAPEELLTKPVVAGGLVLVVSTADTIYAVDQQSGQWRWQYRRESPSDFSIRGAGRPLVIEKRVYAGFGDGFAVALNLADGALDWAKDLGAAKKYSDVDAGPVADGQGHVFFASFANGIFCLEASTGKVIWNASQPNISVLAIDPATHRLFAGGSGMLLGLSADNGAQLWQLALGADRFVSALSVVNGFVLAPTGPGPLLFLDEATGQLRRTFDPGRGIWARPLTLPGRALVLSNRGWVYDLHIEARGGW